MIPNYELQIYKKEDGWDLIFTQGKRRIEVTIASLEEIESFLKENCKGYTI